MNPSILSFLWPSLGYVALYLLVAAVVFWRFRGSASGVLIGGGYALLGVKALVMTFITASMARQSMLGNPAWSLINTLSMLASFVLMLCVAIGIVLIPRSLNRMAKSSPSDGPQAG